MKIRKVKKAISRFKREQRKSHDKRYVLSMWGRIEAMEICLEQLLEQPNKMVYDEHLLHFKKWERMKYKTLKTAFIMDMITEGFRELRDK